MTISSSKQVMNILKSVLFLFCKSNHIATCGKWKCILTAFQQSRDIRASNADLTVCPYKVPYYKQTLEKYKTNHAQSLMRRH